jgi:hypothetical protein
MLGSVCYRDSIVQCHPELLAEGRLRHKVQMSIKVSGVNERTVFEQGHSLQLSGGTVPIPQLRLIRLILNRN